MSFVFVNGCQIKHYQQLFFNSLVPEQVTSSAAAGTSTNSSDDDITELHSEEDGAVRSSLKSKSKRNSRSSQLHT